MKYYDPQEETLIVTQVWKVHVTARRYFNKCMVEIKEKLRPERDCLWKSSVGKYDGYQADLVAFTIDAAPPCGYPDW